MKIKEFFKHFAVVVLSLFVIIGVPFFSTDYFKELLSPEAPDAVSSASIILDMPSGKYIVLINSDLHKDNEKLDNWLKFFNGEEIDYIFEDISCSVAKGDTGAMETAKSFQSRLPENQMRIKEEDALILVSRAEAGLFDSVIMSEEFAKSFDAADIEGKFAKKINLTGEKK